MWALELRTEYCCSATGKNTVRSSSLFRYHLGYRPMPPSLSPLPTDTIHTVLWFYSLGHWWVSDQPRVSIATDRNNSGNVLEGYGNPSVSTRGWRTVTGKDRNQGALWNGEADILVAAGTPRPACCCMFSSLLKLRSQPLGRDWLIGQGQVTWPLPSYAGTGRGRTWPLSHP